MATTFHSTMASPGFCVYSSHDSAGKHPLPIIVSILPDLSPKEGSSAYHGHIYRSCSVELFLANTLLQFKGFKDHKRLDFFFFVAYMCVSSE